MSVTAINLPSPDVLRQLSVLAQPVLDAIPLGVYVCDALGRIVRVNAKAEELWGRKVPLLDEARLFCGSFRLEP